jgi:hypothetical protein
MIKDMDITNNTESLTEGTSLNTDR